MRPKAARGRPTAIWIDKIFGSGQSPASKNRAQVGSPLRSDVQDSCGLFCNGLANNADEDLEAARGLN